MTSGVTPKGNVAILYTDGSCRPNPGPGGSGIHGYVFTETADKPWIISNHFMDFINVKDKEEGNQPIPKSTPTTHGYRTCDKDGNVQGKFPWVRPSFFVDAICSYGDYVTNNVAELLAILHAYNIAMEIEGLERLVIALDSQYALDVVSVNGDWWRDNNWMTKGGSPAANQEHVEVTLLARDAIKAKGVRIEYIKVKGHTDDVGNWNADYNANVGTTWSTFNDIKLDVRWSPGTKKYWDPDVDRHPMLHARRFIYNRKVDLNIPGRYFMIEPADIDLTIGKRDHEGYAVVVLATPCASMQSLMEAQKNFNQIETWPMNLKTDRLYNKFVQKWLAPYGAGTMLPNRSGMGLTFLDGGNVAMEHNPPALIYRAQTIFENLVERLEEFQEKKQDFDLNFPDEYHGIQGLDITNDFYETIQKKVGKETIDTKVLRKEIEVGYQQHFVDIELTVQDTVIKRKLPITLGMDLPPRNSLKKLETEDPKVTLITWRSGPASFKYACIVEAESGIGIWSNYNCDRFFL